MGAERCRVQGAKMNARAKSALMIKPDSWNGKWFVMPFFSVPITQRQTVRRTVRIAILNDTFLDNLTGEKVRIAIHPHRPP
jgi:hypothetical protein